MTDHPLWAIVPVKAFSFAKQRLSPALDATTRRLLAMAMLEDVLLVLASPNTGLHGVLVVTRDQDAKVIAKRCGAFTAAEPESVAGHTSTVTWAITVLEKEGIESFVAIPGDVPLITAFEVAELVGAHGSASAITLVPAHDYRGTNAIACSPPRIIPLSFGNDSFERHLATARQHDIEPCVLPLPGLGLDIDSPRDLESFLAICSDTQSLALLRRSGLGLGITAPKGE